MATIDRMTVELAGDASSYQRMLSDAVGATRQAASAIASSMAGAASSVAAAMAPLGAAAGGAIGLATKSFADAESASMRLQATITASGRAVGPVMESYRQFAGELASTTSIGRTAAMSLFQQAEALGIQGEAAKRAVRNAVSLAAARGLDAQATLKATAALETGSAEMLGEFIPALKQVKDEGSKAAIAHQSLGQMFGVAQAEAGTMSGQMASLQGTFTDAMVEIGSMTAEAITPLVDGLKAVVGYFQGMSKEAKTVVAAALLVTVGVAALAVGFLALGKAVMVATGGLSVLGTILAGAVAAGAAGATVGISSLAISLGGIGAAWKYVKEQALAAWEWLKPIRQAMASFWGAIVDTASGAWKWIQATAVSVWQRIAGAAGVNWLEIRDQVRDAILMAEFMLRNFGQVAALVWAGAKLTVVEWGNTLVYWLTDVVPAAVKWFAANWRDIVNAVVTWSQSAFQALVENIQALFKSIPWASLWEGYKATVKSVANRTVEVLRGIPDAVKRGASVFARIWAGDQEEEAMVSGRVKEALKPIPEMVAQTTAGIPPFQLPVRQIGQLERQLREEFERQRGAVKESWEAFRDKKLKEFQKTGKGVAEASKAGAKVGDAFNRAAMKELERFDAALSGSSEAISRIRDYQEKIAGGRMGALGMSTAAPTTPGGAPQVVVTPAAPVVTQSGVPGQGVNAQADQVELLREIRQILRDIRAKSGGSPPVASP